MRNLLCIGDAVTVETTGHRFANGKVERIQHNAVGRDFDEFPWPFVTADVVVTLTCGVVGFPHPRNSEFEEDPDDDPDGGLALEAA